MNLFSSTRGSQRKDRPTALGLLPLCSAALTSIALAHSQEPSPLSAQNNVPSKKHALLIGVNGDYATTANTEDEWADTEYEDANAPADQARSDPSLNPHALKGPREDVQALKKLLIDLYSYTENDITLLIDDDDENHIQPTKDIILEAIDTLIKQVQPGDQVVFAFSGHGFQRKAQPEDNEEDGMNEFIMASCGNGIKDNILKEKLVLPLHPTCTLVAIFDCCHSATILDLEHNKCNRTVVTPRLNKGKRRSQTLQYQTVRQNGLLVDPQRRSSSNSNSSSIRENSLGTISSYPGSSLRADTLRSNIRRRTQDSLEQQAVAIKSSNGSIPEPPASPSSSTSRSRRPSRKLPQRRRAHNLRIDTGVEVLGLTSTQESGARFQVLSDSCIMESPTKALFDSPKARWCNGFTCHQGPREDEHTGPMADVICLSSSQDNEVTWEDSKGRSMICHLIRILRKENNANPTLHDLMYEITHRIHDSNRRIHEEARKYRCKIRARSYEAAGTKHKRSLAPDGRRLSEYEMTQFQSPELSSRVPLDMKSRKWML